MKINIFSLAFVLFGLTIGQAQSVLNAKSPEELRKMRSESLDVNAKGETVKNESKPLDYGFIEEKDVLWSMVVWEIIDLNEKINQPYYNSTDGVAYSTLSLFDALKKGIEDGKITEVYDDEFFEFKISKEAAINSLIRTDTTDWYYEQKEQGVDMSSVTDKGIDEYPVESDKVKMIKVKGMWYIDRRMSEMKYRVLGIAMMGPDAQTLGRGFEGADDYVDLFWVWYPNARDMLHNYRVFNPQNSATAITYDDMLNARRFNSIIYKTSETMGNRSIEQYIPEDAKAQLEEHHRIRNTILERENDMWNY